MMTMITILTPTFNRAYTLTRLFDALKMQTDKRFEWVIVDDGSTDNTKDLIQIFLDDSEKSFSIFYHYQFNGGKHVAINLGVTKAQGDYIFIVDSDDTLSLDAVEQVLEKIDSERGYGGYCFRRATMDGVMIGNNEIRETKLTMTPNRASEVFAGDLAYVFRKQVLMENTFPIFSGEKFVPELYIWNKIAQKHKILFYSTITVYFTEYLPDGYTHNFKKMLKANPKGFLLFYASQIIQDVSWKRRIKSIIRALQTIYYLAYKKFKLNGTLF